MEIQTTVLLINYLTFGRPYLTLNKCHAKKYIYCILKGLILKKSDFKTMVNSHNNLLCIRSLIHVCIEFIIIIIIIIIIFIIIIIIIIIIIVIIITIYLFRITIKTLQ